MVEWKVVIRVEQRHGAGIGASRRRAPKWAGGETSPPPRVQAGGSGPVVSGSGPASHVLAGSGANRFVVTGHGIVRLSLVPARSRLPGSRGLDAIKEGAPAHWRERKHGNG